MGQGSSRVSAAVDKFLMTPFRRDTFPIYEEATHPLPQREVLISHPWQQWEVTTPTLPQPWGIPAIESSELER